MAAKKTAKPAKETRVNHEEKLKFVSKAKKRRKTFYRMKIKAAERFSVIARQKLGGMIKGIAVIGSLARDDYRPTSDIDMLVIIDDTQRDVPGELKEKIIAMLNDMAKKVDKKLTVQVHTLTEIWDFLKEGDTIIYNFFRHMKPIYDAGIIKPLKRLLESGEVRPTKEAMMKAVEGSDVYMKKIEQYLEWIVERMYRVVTWMGNAYIMSVGKEPASPPEIPIILKRFADEGAIPAEIPTICAEVIKAHKDAEHGEKKPNAELVVKLEKKVEFYHKILKKEIISSMIDKETISTVKYKIKTMPKIIFEMTSERAFVWLLDDGVYMALYEKEKLKKVYKASVQDGRVSKFKTVKSEKLFQSMEASQLKPLLNPKLIKMIHSAMPDTIRKPVKKLAIEYPGRAMLDLTGSIKV
ncbi:MAG: hypothetical protein GOU99_02325 [Candidatus Altiarchaeota archaeon]|nr:hypothetical protein [Candidatus Altiarchaeota archaeon]